MSELEPLISAPADSLSPSLTPFIAIMFEPVLIHLVVAFKVSQEPQTGPFLGPDRRMCW